MATVNYNIRIDKELRDQAFAVLDRYGLPPSQAVKIFLNQIARTNSIPLSFDYEQQPNLSTQRAINELENGGGTSYTNLEDLLVEHDDYANFTNQ